MNILTVLYELLSKWGYAGAFLFSVLGNLIPFLPIPYLALIFLMAATPPYLDPLLLGIMSGIGGGIGKLLVFFITKKTKKFLAKNNEQINAFKKLIGNYGAIAMFLFAATPSPDDIVIITLGIIEYDVKKFFISCTAGKIAISLLASYTGNLYKMVIEYMGYKANIIGTISSIIILIIILIVIMKIDWVLLLKKVNEKGFKAFLNPKNYKLR